MAKRKDYPGYYRRRGESWSCELRVRGRKFCCEVQGDEQDVKRFLRQKRDELAGHIDAGVDVGARFSALLDHYERENAGPAVRVRITEIVTGSPRPGTVIQVRRQRYAVLNALGF